MIVSDELFENNAEMAITFRCWFNVGPGEEIDLDREQILWGILRGREYTRCRDARKRLNHLAKTLLKN